MSSLVKLVSYSTDYNKVAEEIALPLKDKLITDEEGKREYLKEHDLNEALSTGI